VTVGAALRPVGPAQSDWLCHFCGRPAGTGVSDQLPSWINGMTAQQRLANILWSGVLMGSVPFGANSRMVCLSESPPDHLLWLLRERNFPGWGLVFSRQWAYRFGGGPVWYTRNEQYYAMPADQRDWAVRLEAGAADWLHEREWRIRVLPQFAGLQVVPGDIAAILVEDPDWAPWRDVHVRTGYLLDSAGCLSVDGVEEEIRIEQQLPNLWAGVPRIFWDRTTRQLTPLG
jgi:hypothetical protein